MKMTEQEVIWSLARELYVASCLQGNGTRDRAIWEWDNGEALDQQDYRLFAQTALNYLKEQQHYVRLDPDQSLPENPWVVEAATTGTHIAEYREFEFGQKSMLNNYFRKVKKEDL